VTRANTAFDFPFFDVEGHVEKTGKKPLLSHFARSPAVAADPTAGGQVACLTRRQAFLLRRDGITWHGNRRYTAKHTVTKPWIQLVLLRWPWTLIFE